MVLPPSSRAALLARSSPRARLLFVLFALLVVACVVFGAASSRIHEARHSRSTDLVEPVLWPLPSPADFRALRSVRVSRPRQYSKLRIVVEFSWAQGLANTEFAAVSTFLLAKSMGAEVRLHA